VEQAGEEGLSEVHVVKEDRDHRWAAALGSR